jgi:hypothetical protein
MRRRIWLLELCRRQCELLLCAFAGCGRGDLLCAGAEARCQAVQGYASLPDTRRDVRKKFFGGD